MSTPPFSLPLSLSHSLTRKRFFLTSHHPTHPHQPLPLNHRRPTSTTTPQTHYALFPATLPHGPPPTGPFALNPRALRAEYLQLQRRYHPDALHHSAPPHSTSSPPSRTPSNGQDDQVQAQEDARMQGTSAHISSAYRTLLSPLLRAQYLLSLRDHSVSEDTQLGPGDGDAELLSSVLELREEIEGAEGEEEIGRLERENEGRIERCEGLLGEMFERDDLEGARGVVVRLRYWVNVREALGRWEKGGEVVLGH